MVLQGDCRAILDPVTRSWDLVTFFLLPSLCSGIRSQGAAWRQHDRSHLASLPLWTHPPSPLHLPFPSLTLCDHRRQTLTVFSVCPLKGCRALGGQIKRGLPVSRPIGRHRLKQKTGGERATERGAGRDSCHAEGALPMPFKHRPMLSPSQRRGSERWSLSSGQLAGPILE